MLNLPCHGGQLRFPLTQIILMVHSMIIPVQLVKSITGRHRFQRVIQETFLPCNNFFTIVVSDKIIGLRFWCLTQL
jgi:hypothetical protein